MNNPEQFPHTDLTGYENKNSRALYATEKSNCTCTVWVMQCKHCGMEFEVPACNVTRRAVKHLHCPALRSSQSRTLQRKIIYDKERFIKSIHKRYAKSAKSRDLVFELTLQQVTDLIEQDCTYCGTPPIITSKDPEQQYAWNGIDRVNSELGYIIGNCVPCCFTCNFSKSTKTVVEFTAWVERTYRHLFRIQAPIESL